MKKCSKCKEPKDLVEFGKDARRLDGLRSACKACTNIMDAEYRAVNRDKTNARNAARYAANIEKERSRSLAYRNANPEKARARSAAWYSANREKVNAASAAWHAANPDKVRASQAVYRIKNYDKLKAKRDEWNAKNPGKARQISAAWRAANSDREKKRSAAWYAANIEAKRVHKQNRRARERESGGRLSSNLAAKLFKLQKGKCACCGIPLGDNYHLDHIIPIFLGGTNTDDNIQLLRPVCNRQKSAKHPIDFMQGKGFLL